MQVIETLKHEVDENFSYIVDWVFTDAGDWNEDFFGVYNDIRVVDWVFTDAGDWNYPW